VQARIIAATNRDLYQMSSEGRFRSDLYYRLNVITMQMPPLRDRGQDVLLLANYFRQMTEKRYALPHHEFSAMALMAIQSYHWPGNVREMRHQISRAVLMCTQAMISEHDLGLPQIAVVNPSASMQGEAQVTLDDAEKAMLLNALEQSRHNVSKAARLLGITRMTMRYRMDKHGISV
jgi:DNA-binding NtrC family response regulator